VCGRGACHYLRALPAENFRNPETACWAGGFEHSTRDRSCLPARPKDFSRKCSGAVGLKMPSITPGENRSRSAVKELETGGPIVG
jgi:hypothetical protein